MHFPESDACEGIGHQGWNVTVWIENDTQEPLALGVGEAII